MSCSPSRCRTGPAFTHGLFGSHPRNDKRLHDVVGEAVPLAGVNVRPPERDFWAMLDGLVFGDEAATGLVQGSTYYHSGLRIVVSFPEGWDLGNTASEVFGRDLSGAADADITGATAKSRLPRGRRRKATFAKPSNATTSKTARPLRSTATPLTWRT